MHAIQFEASVRQRPERDLAIIDLIGDVAASAQLELERAYIDAVATRPRRLLLNFSQVGYINSTGIALIVGVLMRARQEGRAVLACGLSEHYREIFQITRLADFLEIVADEASAVRGLDQQ